MTATIRRLGAIRQEILVVLFSGIGGISGYLFNLLVARLFGPVLLGRLLAGLGAGSCAALPAALLVLPVARWTAQTADWRQRLPLIQAGAIGVGCLAAFGTLLFGIEGHVLRSVPNAMWIPLSLWVVPGYLSQINVGVLMGRRAYTAMVISSAAPLFAKLMFILPARVLGPNDMSAAWAVATANWIGVGVGAWITYRAPRTFDAIAPPSSTWPSAWVGAMSSTWLTLDVTISSLILPPASLAIYATAATLGKTPYYLVGSLVNMGMGESAWRNGRPWVIRSMIIAVGSMCVAGGLVFGQGILRLFGLHHGVIPLIIFMIALTVFSWGYFEAGVAAQRGQHAWIPLGLALPVWAFLGLITHPQLIELCLELATILTIGSVITYYLSRVHHGSSDAHELT